MATGGRGRSRKGPNPEKITEIQRRDSQREAAAQRDAAEQRAQEEREASSTADIRRQGSKRAAAAQIEAPSNKRTRTAQNGEPKERKTKEPKEPVGPKEPKTKAPTKKAKNDAPPAEEDHDDESDDGAPAEQIPESVMITRLSGDEMSLRDTLKETSKGAVLFFYPKASTPGCTTQGKNFNASLADFTKKGITVFGISRDKVPAQEKFKEKQGFEYELLSDAKGQVAGFFKIKKGTSSVVRSVYVVSKDGKVLGGGQVGPKDSVPFAQDILKKNKL